MTEQKHANYIRLWADGAELEYEVNCFGADQIGEWLPVESTHNWGNKATKYRSKSERTTECATKNCLNRSNEGLFVGLFCKPCHDFVKGDGGLHSQVNRNFQIMLRVALAEAMPKYHVKKELVRLNDEEIYKVFDRCRMQVNRPPTEDAMPVFARAIEAKIMEKNA